MSISAVVELVGIFIAIVLTVIAAIGTRVSLSGKRRQVKSSSGATWRLHPAVVSVIISAALIVGGTVIAAFASNVLELSPSPGPTVTITSSSPSSPTASGSITFPLNGADYIPGSSILRATGTVHNLEKGHHLDLFISPAGSNRYFTADPNSITLTGRRWAGKIFIGLRHAQFTLWLVDLGPQSFRILLSNVVGQSTGFSSLKLASDTTILYSVTFTSQ